MIYRHIYVVILVEEDRKNTIKEKDDIYLCIDDNDEIVSTVKIKDGYVDDLIVSKSYEGKGIGQEATKFAINVCRQFTEK